MNTLPSKVRGAGGVAILVALMVVTVVSTIAIKHSWRSELDLTRAGHRWASIQAKAYSEGAENLAVIALNKDLENSQLDSLNELWATGFDFPTDHGAMRITIIDAQSRLNLNNLRAPFKRPPNNNNNQPQVGHRKYEPDHLRFLRLLQMIPIDEELNFLASSDAEAILEAVKDWVDADNTVEGFGGAEQDYYQQLEPSITVPNGDMVSVSELRYIKGITPTLYQGLLPYVTSLPGTTELNVNTMGAWLARTLNSDQDVTPLSAEEGEQLFNEIFAADPETAEDFNGIPFVGTLFPPGANNQAAMNMAGLAFATRWFELDITVTVGDHVRRSRSLIERAAVGNIRVARRSDTRF